MSSGFAAEAVKPSDNLTRIPVSFPDGWFTEGVKTNPSRGEITIMAGGAVTLIFSFLAFYSIPQTDVTVNAWDDLLFPIAAYPAFAGAVSGGITALRRFGSSNLTARPGGFTWDQVHRLLGIFAVLIIVGYFVTNKGGLDLGIGFYGMAAGSIAALVGAVMLSQEHHGPRGLA